MRKSIPLQHHKCGLFPDHRRQRFGGHFDASGNDLAPHYSPDKLSLWEPKRDGVKTKKIA